ncbi:hypothetical protein LOK49_LG01G01622 [Camellia lanceoleosa]|uniref:Uncharacterized protein n=1 Tax=Camellia lanceoleosa TaxID=1840588 RepID=A0ACC0IX07_9ERIC|nr:hypothetical protein LOK49_LG01G01622 [Camellia lanceoleosa]
MLSPKHFCTIRGSESKQASATPISISVFSESTFFHCSTSADGFVYSSTTSFPDNCRSKKISNPGRHLLSAFSHGSGKPQNGNTSIPVLAVYSVFMHIALSTPTGALAFLALLESLIPSCSNYFNTSYSTFSTFIMPKSRAKFLHPQFVPPSHVNLKRWGRGNFDDVLVPEDHVSRSYNDTYYVDSQAALRCHISAHQAELLRKGHTHFLLTGDVYLRDSIDSTHYSIFHQMEGFQVFTPDDWEPSGMDGTSYVAEDLKKCLEGLARHLFGTV